MVGKTAALTGQVRVSDYLSVGLLSRLVPPSLVDEALTAHHVFSHDAATDVYLLMKETSIPIDLDSWHHACSVDRTSNLAQ